MNILKKCFRGDNNSYTEETINNSNNSPSLGATKHNREQLTKFTPFVFKSTNYQRPENGIAVMGVQSCMRTVSVEKNTAGCEGYNITAGCIVKVFNNDLNKPNMSDMPVDLVDITNEKVVFRGYSLEAMSPSGWQKVDYSDYRFTVHYSNNSIFRYVLHMYDRNIEYVIGVNSAVYQDNIV